MAVIARYLDRVATVARIRPLYNRETNGFAHGIVDVDEEKAAA